MMFSSSRLRCLILAIPLFILNNSNGVQCQGSLISAPVWPYQTFKTTNFTPPELAITKQGTQAKGFLFIGQAGPDAAVPPLEAAPLIMTDDNQLVWNGPKSQTFVFGAQTYQGKPVLVYWNGTIFPEPVGRGSGVIHILDQSYEQTAQVSLAGTFLTLTPNQTIASNIDLHEIYITKNNTVLVTANNVTQTDLRSVGGPENGWVVDSLVYEIDIATNTVLFRWSALEHLEQLPLSLSLYPLGAEGYSGVNQSVAWGYFHINSVAPFEGGYLISSRYFCSGIAINRKGDVKWRLQGRDGGDFTLGNGTNFCYQHDIRASRSSPNIALTMHNNFNSPIDNGTHPTTGLKLNVNLDSKAVSLDRMLHNPKDIIYSTAQGSYQPLPQNRVLLGHGFTPKIEEFDSTGQTTMTVTFGPAPAIIISYRAFRQEWVGCPTTTPAIAVEPENGGLAVYMSWNGATEYDSWNIYSGGNMSGLVLVDTVVRDGFETRAVIPNATYVQAEAVSPSGNGCGSTCAKSSVYTAQ